MIAKRTTAVKTIRFCLVLLSVVLLFVCSKPNDPGVPPGDGTISFEKSQCRGTADVVKITVSDSDLTVPTTTVKVTSPADPTGITLPLTKDTATKAYSATLGFSLSASSAGIIKVTNADVITASFTDNGETPISAGMTWNISLKDLFDAAVFEGWIPDSSNHFEAFDGLSLFNRIDGSGQQFIDGGIDSATIKLMTSTDSSKNCKITIMDFNTNAKSSAIFNLRVSKNQAATAITSFNPSEAVGLVLYRGNILVYAHFNQIYLEIELTGYDAFNDSVRDAVIILARYKSITF
jgi:hypothetical protein